MRRWHDREVAGRGVDECIGGTCRDQPPGHEGDSGVTGSRPLRQCGASQFHGACGLLCDCGGGALQMSEREVMNTLVHLYETYHGECKLQ